MVVDGRVPDRPVGRWPLFFWCRGTLFEKRWLMWVFVFAVVAPFIANQAGWVAAESGRQPFIVYPEVVWDGDTPRMVTDGASPGLRTSVGMSSTKVVTAGQVLSSILMFSFVYLHAVRRLGLRPAQQDRPRPRRGRAAAAGDDLAEGICSTPPPRSSPASGARR